MLLVLFVVLATFTAALVGGFLHATRIADEDIRNNERQLLENQLEVTMHDLLSAQTIQLTWDDAMRNVGGQGQSANIAWADTYMGECLRNTVKADEMYLITPTGTVLRAWRAGRPSATSNYDPLAPRVSKALATMRNNTSLSGPVASFRQLADTRWPFNSKDRPLSRWSGQILDVNGGPALMTVISLLPDADYQLLHRTPNHVVTIRRLDATMLKQIGAGTLLHDLRFTRSQPADPHRNGLALVDGNDRVLGWLTWQPHVVGPLLLARTAPLLVGYVVFYCIVLAFALILIRQTLRVSRELAASEARAQYNSLHDSLLGLPNRTYVMQRVTALLASREHEDEQIVLAYFDLDRFKAINESVGHHVGDDVLVQVVERIRRSMRAGDVLGRLASDEFVMVRRGSSGKAAADALGAELMGIFAEPFSVFGQSVPVTASCGISWAPEQAEDAKTSRWSRPRRAVGPVTAASPRKWTPPFAGAVTWKANCAGLSPAITSRWSTSRSSTSPTARSPASRRWCAGIIPNAATSARALSCQWPNSPA